MQPGRPPTQFAPWLVNGLPMVWSFACGSPAEFADARQVVMQPAVDDQKTWPRGRSRTPPSGGSRSGPSHRGRWQFDGDLVARHCCSAAWRRGWRRCPAGQVLFSGNGDPEAAAELRELRGGALSARRKASSALALGLDGGLGRRFWEPARWKPSKARPAAPASLGQQLGHLFALHRP